MLSDAATVPSSSFSASSSEPNRQPANARLDSVSGWQAQSGDQSPWLQVDLGEPVNVTGIITQGMNVSKTK